jgi:hypothetical protein
LNTYLVTGTTIVVFALIAYSIGIITEQRKHFITKTVLRFVSIGIVLDITATSFMIIGSPNSPFSFHGFLGYSSLTAMLIDVILIWRFHIKFPNQKVPQLLHLYSRYAYIWWVLAFITGGLVVALK